MAEEEIEEAEKAYVTKFSIDILLDSLRCLRNESTNKKNHEKDIFIDIVQSFYDFFKGEDLIDPDLIGWAEGIFHKQTQGRMETVKSYIQNGCLIHAMHLFGAKKERAIDYLCTKTKYGYISNSTLDTSYRRFCSYRGRDSKEIYPADYPSLYDAIIWFETNKSPNEPYAPVDIKKAYTDTIAFLFEKFFMRLWMLNNKESELSRFLLGYELDYDKDLQALCENLSCILVSHGCADLAKEIEEGQNYFDQWRPE